MRSINRVNILCIDDDRNNLFTLSSLLKTVPELNPIEAISGQDGLRVLLKNRIDLILLDIQMPDMNGFEVAKLVKSNKKTKDIPIVFITAVFKQDEFLKEGFDIGAIDYLTKPIDDRQLLNKILLYTKIFEKNFKLKESNKRFYSIAQSIDNGIYVLDKDLKTTFINQKALKLLGYYEHELIGNKIHNYIHYKDKNERQILEKDCPIHKTLILNKIFIDNDTVLTKKNGDTIPVSIVATPLFEDSEVTGTVVYFKDKTNEIKIKKLKNSIIKDQEQFIDSLVDMIESRDSYTAGHTRRVAEYCEIIAKEMKYSEKDIRLLKKAAILHDIGKISTPDSILLKPGVLTALEYKLIQEHVVSGYNILSNIDSYKDVADIMHEHHERYDGSGYPKGLKREDINELSRIMMVADSFDAMTTNRIYKAKKTPKDALQEIFELSGKFYHPEVVDAAISSLRGIFIKENISQLPNNELERERFSYFYKDRLTGAYDFGYIYIVARHYIINKKVYLYVVELKNFSKFNELYGWERGDDFLRIFSSYIRRLFKKVFIFRIRGDDFLILSERALHNISEKVKDCIELKKYKDILSCETNKIVVEDIKSLVKEKKIESMLRKYL